MATKWNDLKHKAPPEKREQLSQSSRLAADKFVALRALENQRVLLTFRDGQSFIARLLSVTSDLDRSQHLVLRPG